MKCGQRRRRQQRRRTNCDQKSSIEPLPQVSSKRICLDPSDLNKVVERAHHPVKTVMDIVSNVPYARRARR